MAQESQRARTERGNTNWEATADVLVKKDYGDSGGGGGHGEKWPDLLCNLQCDCNRICLDVGCERKKTQW